MLCNSAEFAPHGGRQRLAVALLRALTRLAVKPALSPRVPVARQRRRLKRLTRSLRPRVRAEAQAAAVGGVDGEWLGTPGAPVAAGNGAAILYLHGGGYCIGSPATHRAITARLARAAGLPVFAADYRLAPEHPFPAAVDDAVAAYRALQQAGPVAVAGDSAGAGLALATCLAARERRLPLPAALVLFSPWLDLTLSMLDAEAARGEAVLSRDWLADCARRYLAGSDPAAPLASPLFADLRGFPSTLIQVAADELLYPDAVRIHDALAQAGVAVRCEVLDGLWHVFQLQAGALAAAAAAVDRAGQFVSLACAASADGPPQAKAL